MGGVKIFWEKMGWGVDGRPKNGGLKFFFGKNGGEDGRPLLCMHIIRNFTSNWKYQKS